MPHFGKPRDTLDGKTTTHRDRRAGDSELWDEEQADGELHGPYTYLSVPGSSGRPRMIYLPTDLVDPVTGQLDASGRIDAVLAEIAAINTELLVRREQG